ncbi:MAG: hypothetical protein MUC56_15535 [Thermoanaerobaculales bacterium]|nr:hypothetical protein [Thermoanaerobaculales bacterium]
MTAQTRIRLAVSVSVCAIILVGSASDCAGALSRAETTDFMHARYYSPNLGRFVSVDPVGGTIGSSQSWNRYSYVDNNPIAVVDPDGEAEFRVVNTWGVPDNPYQFYIRFNTKFDNSVAAISGSARVFGAANTSKNVIASRNLLVGLTSGGATGLALFATGLVGAINEAGSTGAAPDEYWVRTDDPLHDTAAWTTGVLESEVTKALGVGDGLYTVEGVMALEEAFQAVIADNSLGLTDQQRQDLAAAYNFVDMMKAAAVAWAAAERRSIHPVFASIEERVEGYSN